MRLFVKRDLDGFFGLFVDNMVQLLLVVALCAGLCGMSGDNAYFIFGRILPGAAVSLLLGNVFYAWQAHRLARRTGRTDVTALPYGINTVSLLVYVFFVMAPTYARTSNAELAWKMGLLASVGSGLIELVGSLVAESVRRRTPRAALLSTLAGIAIGYISMAFALQIWARPLVALVPLAIVLVTMFSGLRFPWGLPGGLVAVGAGTLLAWVLPGEWTGVTMGKVASVAGWSAPVWCGGEIVSVFRELPAQQWLGFFAVIVPMGLFNVVGSLQNIESAEAAGDSYETRSSLAVNGIGTIAGALFGSCFPTTIYIGHPGWKALGARAGYSTLNGLVITLICLIGAVSTVGDFGSNGGRDRNSPLDWSGHYSSGISGNAQQTCSSSCSRAFPCNSGMGCNCRARRLQCGRRHNGGGGITQQACGRSKWLSASGPGDAGTRLHLHVHDRRSDGSSSNRSSLFQCLGLGNCRSSHDASRPDSRLPAMWQQHRLSAHNHDGGRSAGLQQGEGDGYCIPNDGCCAGRSWDVRPTQEVCLRPGGSSDLTTNVIIAVIIQADAMPATIIVRVVARHLVRMNTFLRSR